MPKYQVKENTFQAGEVSPLYFGRTESAAYQSGLAIAENVFVEKRGGIFRRGGNQHIGQVDGNEGRILTKQISTFRFDLIVIRDSQMVISGPGLGYLSANLVTNPYFVTRNTGWSVAVSPSTAQVLFYEGVAELVPDQATLPSVAKLSQSVTAASGNTASYTVQVRQVGNALLTVKIGTSDGADDIAMVTSNREAIDLSFVPNNANFWITVESDAATSAGSKVDFIGAIATADLGGVGKEFASPWTVDQLAQVHIIEDPDGESIYFCHPNVPQQKLDYNFDTNVYAFSQVTFTSPPANWAAGNYPATGAFYQGRLWFAATPNRPQRFWGSKSGVPENFDPGTGLDNEALDFTLQKFGRIRWMIGTKDMLIGTENAEHILTSAGGVITPKDFRIEQQSSYGSNTMQVVQLGASVMYMTPDGRRLQAIDYEWTQNNWLSQDLTNPSEHITRSGIHHRAWGQNPRALLFMVKEDGTVAVMTYDPTGETIGWTRYVYENFRVIDAAVGTIEGRSRLVMIGQRSPTGAGGFVGGKLDIERESEDPVYMDAYVEEFSEALTDTLDGLDHLEGETVQVVVDGSVEPPKVVSGGQIVTDRLGNLIQAGKQINSTITTLPPDTQGSSMRSWKKRWNKVWALLYNSNVPIINGTRPPDRSPSTPMNTPEPRTTDHHKTLNLGWDDFGRITIEENLPVPMNILAIYGELGVENID